MEALALVPRDGTTTEDAFTKLATNFKLSEVVKDALIRSKLENLEEFRFLFDEESKVEPWVVKLKLGDDHTVQAARLRRAWSAVRLYFQQSEQDRSKVTASDLDSMLGDTELRDTKLQFWRRYRQRYPAEVRPSDATLSRVTREMSKRMLCVFNIWKVRSLQFQLHTSTKKRKVGENLFTEDKEDEEQCDQDWETYLNKLHTLLLAYSMAGSSPLAPPAGDATRFDSLGADATKYLEVPLDVAIAYFWRAKRTTCVVPMSKRLQWLKSRDTEERSEWVSRFRESTDTLGVIIKEVMVARDAHWIPAITQPGSDPVSTGGGDAKQPQSPNPAKTSHFQLGKPINGKQVARTMRDGTKLCQAFQHGQCKNKTPCPSGQHRCAAVTKKERICGASGHGAAACRNNQKA